MEIQTKDLFFQVNKFKHIKTEASIHVFWLWGFHLSAKSDAVTCEKIASEPCRSCSQVGENIM